MQYDSVDNQHSIPYSQYIWPWVCGPRLMYETSVPPSRTYVRLAPDFSNQNFCALVMVVPLCPHGRRLVQQENNKPREGFFEGLHEAVPCISYEFNWPKAPKSKHFFRRLNVARTLLNVGPGPYSREACVTGHADARGRARNKLMSHDASWLLFCPATAHR